MAHTKSTKKRMKTNEVRRQRNIARRSHMRHAVRDARGLLKQSSGEMTDELKSRLREVQRLLDRMAGKGVIHPNKAARLKSRLLSTSSSG